METTARENIIEATLNKDVIQRFPKIVQKISYVLNHPHKQEILQDISMPGHFENGRLTEKSAITSVGMAAAFIETNKKVTDFPKDDAVKAFQAYGILVSANVPEAISKSVLRQVNKATRRFDEIN